MKQIFLMVASVMGCVCYIQAESWTNCAGQVLAAEIISVSNNIALFKDKKNKVRHYRIKSFPKSEQIRMRKKTKTLLVPASIAAEKRSSIARLSHIRKLLEGNIINAAGAKKRRAVALRLFEHQARAWYRKKNLVIDEDLIAALKKQLSLM